MGRYGGGETPTPLRSRTGTFQSPGLRDGQVGGLENPHSTGEWNGDFPVPWFKRWEDMGVRTPPLHSILVL